MYRYMVAIAVGLLGWACSSVWAHEPLFGVGPHTMYQYGTEVETEVEADEGSTGIDNEISYGITPDLGVTLAVPYVRKEAGNMHNSGLGDVTLRAKAKDRVVLTGVLEGEGPTLALAVEQIGEGASASTGR